MSKLLTPVKVTRASENTERDKLLEIVRYMQKYITREISSLHVQHGYDKTMCLVKSTGRVQQHEAGVVGSFSKWLKEAVFHNKSVKVVALSSMMLLKLNVF